MCLVIETQACESLGRRNVEIYSEMVKSGSLRITELELEKSQLSGNYPTGAVPAQTTPYFKNYLKFEDPAMSCTLNMIQLVLCTRALRP